MQLAFAGLVRRVSESCLVVQIAAMAYRGTNEAGSLKGLAAEMPRDIFSSRRRQGLS